MTFPREIQLLSSELRHAYLRSLIICKCITFVTSERFQKLERDIQNGDDIDRADKRQFIFTEKRFRNISSLIGVSMFLLWNSICILGLKKIKKKTVYFIEQWDL